MGSRSNTLVVSGHSMALVLAVSAAVGCAPQQQAREQPLAAEQAPSRGRPTSCPAQMVGYDDASEVGLSAAQIVAKFGSERRAALVTPNASGGEALPAEIRISVTYTRGDVKIVRCPTNFVRLSIPVRVALESAPASEVVFDAKLVAGDTSEVRVEGSAHLFGSDATVVMRLDADDVELVLTRRDRPRELRWTSLCQAEAGKFLNDFFTATPVPLVPAGLKQALTCVEAAEPARAAQLAGARHLPPLLLNAVDPLGCRDLGQGNVGRFRGEVVASDDTAWMPQPARADISVDANAGIAKVEFHGELPSSGWLRAFHACPQAEAATLRYWLELERGSAGVALKSQVFELAFSCDGVVVRCSSAGQ